MSRTHISFFTITGGVGSLPKQKYDTNSSYDYVENQGTLPIDGQSSVAIYQEAVLYHSVGPDVSKPAKIATKTDQSRSTGNESAPNLYEAPATQKFRVSAINIYSMRVHQCLLLVLY